MGSFLTFFAGLGIGGGSCSFLISSFGSSLTCGDELFEFRAVRRGFDVLELFGLAAARSGFCQGSTNRQNYWFELGCPGTCQEPSDFLHAYKKAYCTQHIKNKSSFGNQIFTW